MKAEMKKTRLYWWIANLGVVPLFLLAALRAAPIFFFLFFLMIFVFFVKDAIILILQWYTNISKIIIHFYQKYTPIVKRSYIPASSKNAARRRLFAISYTYLLTTALISWSQHSEEDIFLARGEQIAIDLNKELSQYSVGNKEVVSFKWLKAKKQVLIKGKSLGFSDVIIWSHQNKQHFRVFVVSKKEQFNKAMISDYLKQTSLKTRIIGHKAKVSGTITEKSHYLLLFQLWQQFSDHLSIDVKLDKNLKNSILAQAYRYFERENIEDLSCQVSFGWLIDCHIFQVKLSSRQIQHLSQNLGVRVTSASTDYENTNFQAEMKVVQLESKSHLNLGFGISHISSPWQSYWDNGIKGLISENHIDIKKDNVHIETLAEPTGQLSIDHPMEIKIGADIPFQAPQNQNNFFAGQVLQWRHAGLTVRITLKSQQGHLSLSYQTEFTQPDGENISGSKQKGHINIKTNNLIPLFEVTYQIQSQSKEMIPLIGEIPILGHLFSNQKTGNQYKKIVGLLKISKVP